MNPYALQKSIEGIDALCTDEPLQVRLGKVREKLLFLQTGNQFAEATPFVRKSLNAYFKSQEGSDLQLEARCVRDVLAAILLACGQEGTQESLET